MRAQPEPPPVGPAWDHPPTRRGLGRYRRRSWLWILAGVLLVLVAAMAQPSKVQAANNETRLAALVSLNSLLAAPFFLGTGVWALRFAAHAPNILQASSWHQVEFEYRLARGFKTSRRMVRLDGEEEVELYAAPWRLRYLRESPSGTLWVAERNENYRLVLTANAGVDLFCAVRR